MVKEKKRDNKYGKEKLSKQTEGDEDVFDFFGLKLSSVCEYLLKGVDLNNNDLIDEYARTSSSNEKQALTENKHRQVIRDGQKPEAKKEKKKKELSNFFENGDNCINNKNQVKNIRNENKSLKNTSTKDINNNNDLNTSALIDNINLTFPIDETRNINENVILKKENHTNDGSFSNINADISVNDKLKTKPLKKKHKPKNEINKCLNLNCGSLVIKNGNKEIPDACASYKKDKDICNGGDHVNYSKPENEHNISADKTWEINSNLRISPSESRAKAITIYFNQAENKTRNFDIFNIYNIKIKNTVDNINIIKNERLTNLDKNNKIKCEKSLVQISDVIKITQKRGFSTTNSKCFSKNINGDTIHNSNQQSVNNDFSNTIIDRLINNKRRKNNIIKRKTYRWHLHLTTVSLLQEEFNNKNNFVNHPFLLSNDCNRRQYLTSLKEIDVNNKKKIEFYSSVNTNFSLNHNSINENMIVNNFSKVSLKNFNNASFELKDSQQTAIKSLNSNLNNVNSDDNDQHTDYKNLNTNNPLKIEPTMKLNEEPSKDIRKDEFSAIKEYFYYDKKSPIALGVNSEDELSYNQDIYDRIVNYKTMNDGEDKFENMFQNKNVQDYIPIEETNQITSINNNNNSNKNNISAKTGINVSRASFKLQCKSHVGYKRHIRVLSSSEYSPAVNGESGWFSSEGPIVSLDEETSTLQESISSDEGNDNVFESDKYFKEREIICAEENNNNNNNNNVIKFGNNNIKNNISNNDDLDERQCSNDTLNDENKATNNNVDWKLMKEKRKPKAVARSCTHQVEAIYKKSETPLREVTTKPAPLNKIFDEQRRHTSAGRMEEKKSAHNFSTLKTLRLNDIGFLDEKKDLNYGGRDSPNEGKLLVMEARQKMSIIETETLQSKEERNPKRNLNSFMKRSEVNQMKENGKQLIINKKVNRPRSPYNKLRVQPEPTQQGTAVEKYNKAALSAKTHEIKLGLQKEERRLNDLNQHVKIFLKNKRLEKKRDFQPLNRSIIETVEEEEEIVSGRSLEETKLQSPAETKPQSPTETKTQSPTETKPQSPAETKPQRPTETKPQRPTKTKPQSPLMAITRLTEVVGEGKPPSQHLGSSFEKVRQWMDSVMNSKPMKKFKSEKRPIMMYLLGILGLIALLLWSYRMIFPTPPPRDFWSLFTL